MSIMQFLDTQAAFALRVKHLQDLLNSQMEMAMRDAGLAIPSKVTGIVQLLYSEGEQSIAQIASRLGYSHQLATQRIQWLLKHNMAETGIDPSDRRKQNLKLTRLGRSEGNRLQQFLPSLSDAYSSLFRELGLDLDAAIIAACSALELNSIGERILGAESASDIIERLQS